MMTREQKAAPDGVMNVSVGSMVFVVAMLGAAALSFVRVLGVAAALPKLEFGQYATVTATGAFLASVISFGLVEGTVKSFPRLASQHRMDEMRGRAHHQMLHLLARSAVLGLPIVLVGVLVGVPVVTMAGVGFVFAFSANYNAIVASMQRAIGNPRTLVAGTLLRALLSFVIVIAVAQTGQIVPTLVAEAGAAMLGGYLSERLFVPGTAVAREVRSASPSAEQAVIADPTLSEPAVAEPVQGRADGIRVFLTYTAVSVPFYLDRLYVNATLGADQGAEYAFLALFLMAASLLINAVSQRVGPEAIKLSTTSTGLPAARRHIALWSCVCAGLWLVGLTVAGAIFALGLMPPGLVKYDVQPDLLIPIGVLGAFFVTALVEFLVIGLDSEKELLRSALTYLFLVLVAAAAVPLFRLGLVDLLWMLAAARGVYLGLLVVILRRARPAAALYSAGPVDNGVRDV